MSDSETENLINSRRSSIGSCKRIVQPILAEFVGVCLFVFIGCMATQTNCVIAVALAHGLTITMLIIGLGAISGGHFNPAVTLGVVLAGAVEPALALCYLMAQLLGGWLGAALVRAVLPPNIYDNIKGGSHSLAASLDPGWAIVGEAVLTTLLVSTFLMSAVNRKTKTELAPLAIGFTVAVGIMSGGSTTGTSMNPARALGPALVSSDVVSHSFDSHYVWWVGPLLGGLVSGLLYSLQSGKDIISYSETEILMNTKHFSTGYYETTVRPILAEFVGVCLLVFIGCMSLQDNLQTTVALAHGLTIALLIIGLGGISGGHFNPAVSLGVTLAGAINPELAMGYTIGQVLGGLFGAVLVRAMIPTHVYTNIKGGNQRLGTDVESSQAILGEAILTTALVLTFLMSTVNRRTKSNLAPLAIGFAVAVGIISGGPTTGAFMNPARALGPAIVSYGVMADSFDELFVWWMGPLLGGLVAGLLYRFLFASSDQRWITGDRLCIKKLLTDIEHILT